MAVLLLLCAAAALALLWLRQRPGGGEAGMRVVGRLALEPRRAIYMIEAGGRCFLVGVGDGPMTLLSEIDPPALAVVGDAAPGARA